jgi:hypothetical protein
MPIDAERIEQLRADLDTLSEQLADVALDLLHQAMRDPDPKASPSARDEKLVTRARRSVEKADTLLRQIEASH